MAGKNWYHAAGIIWPLLVDTAKRRGTLTYTDIAPTINTNPLSVGRALGPIQDYCLANRLPPLTAIVVGKTSQQPGRGFIAWDVDDLDAAHSLVWDFNWRSQPNPYAKFGTRDTLDTLADRLVTNPGASAEVYAKVRVRGLAQDVFRAALRKAYATKCAICRFSFSDALDAAHIISWGKASAQQRMDPRNGLLLCSLHHRLFDAGLITVSESLKVVYYDPKMKDGPYSTADKSLTVDLHGKKIHLPKSRTLWPSPRFLAERHLHLNWGKLP